MTNNDIFDDPDFFEDNSNKTTPKIYFNNEYKNLYNSYVNYIRHHTKRYDGVHTYNRHHIKPRKLYPQYVDDPDNLLFCTVKQHTNLHYLYWKYSNNEYMRYAFMKMLETHYKNMSLQEYEDKIFPRIKYQINRYKKICKKRIKPKLKTTWRH